MPTDFSSSFITDEYRITALHLVYAIGGRFLETSGETGDFHSEQHCEKAIENLDEIIQKHASLRSVQILVLLALYNLRSPKGPGAWTFVGLAIRQCISLGLHRQTRMKWPLIEEMRRRVFWTCYCLDRQVSIILGRPFAISDRDIDAELPTDVDEDVEDLEYLSKLQQDERDQTELKPPVLSSSLTGFIYLCRLRMIESEIQQTTYRVDKAAPKTLKTDVEGFVAQLEEWRAAMPLDAQKSKWVDSYDDYMVYYYKALRFLLYPVILSSDVTDTALLQKCAEACAGVCRTYKKLHQKVTVGFSVMALHSIFIAGLTLVCCTWLSPREVFSISTSNGLDACSIVLYVISERWTGARKYRDVFDVVKQEVLETIDSGGEEPQQAINNLKQKVLSALKMAGGSDAEVGEGEFSAMVNGMTGTDDAMTEQDEAGMNTNHEAREESDGRGPSSQTNFQDMAWKHDTGPFDSFNFDVPLEGLPTSEPSFGSGGDVNMVCSEPVNLSPGRWGAGNPVLSYERFS